MSYSVRGTKIILTRGDTFRCTVGIKRDDDTAYEIQEGDSVRFAAKKTYADADPCILVDIPVHTMILHIKPEHTKELAFGQYVYDIELTTANGDVDTFIKGTIDITEEAH